MDFSGVRYIEDGGRGAGSAKAIMSDPDNARVMGAFGDGALRCYHMDIREKKSYWRPTVMNQLRSFTTEYGADDAVKIVDRLFGVLHEGKWRGEVVGMGIFSQQKRWMADILLAEAEKSSGLKFREI